MAEQPGEQRERVTFESITLERFRGFNVEKTIPLDASAVILSGTNGRGKTSLIDGIQWLLLGRITRLHQLRSRQNEEYIVNAYATPGASARVAARVNLSDGSAVSIERRGDYRSSFLSVTSEGPAGWTLNGDQATEWLEPRLLGAASTSSFERVFLTTALLEQDEVRAFLSTNTPAQRFDTLSRLLGLSQMEDFVNALSESGKTLDSAVKKLAVDLQTASTRREDASHLVEEVRARVTAAPAVRDADTGFRQIVDQLGLDSLAQARGWFSDPTYEVIARDIGVFELSANRLQVALTLAKEHLNGRPSVDLEQLGIQLRDAAQAKESLDSQLSGAAQLEADTFASLEHARHQSRELSALASAAIPLLASQCPVCGQNIEPSIVTARLESLVNDDSALVAATQAFDRARESTQQIRDRAAQATEAHNSLSSTHETANRWKVQLTIFLDDVRKEVASSSELWGAPLGAIDEGEESRWLADLESRAVSVTETLTLLSERGARARAAHAALTEGDQSPRLQATLDQRQRDVDQARVAVDAAIASRTRRTQILGAARESMTQVVSQAFDQLGPVVQDLFSRLAPHPTFRSLSFSHDVYRNRGTSVPVATDQDTNKSISPIIGFSSAQSNVAALCYFIALAFASSESDFGFVVLDDPLQSMDDVNVLGFSDLCRFLRREKQLIVTSHEERLANLLRRKLAPRGEPLQTITLEFTSWNRPGPEIRVIRDEMVTEPGILDSIGA